MLQCDNCETAQFLQISKSRIYFEDEDRVSEISEEYECTLCGGEGAYVYDDERDEKEVTGDISRTAERPRHA